MKIALLLLLVSTIASAEIYKYVDPVTGAVEYLRQPKPGAVAMGVDTQAAKDSKELGFLWFCKDEKSGATEQVHLPAIGCYRAGGDLIVDENDLAIETTRWQSEVALRGAMAKDKVRKMRAGFAALSKTHPKSCNKMQGELVCSPAPGMSIAALVDALELDLDGFTHDSRGRQNRYRYHSCVILANARVVTFVRC